MANKKNIKVRDLKPNKDAKGGGGIHAMGAGKTHENKGGSVHSDKAGKPGFNT